MPRAKVSAMPLSLEAGTERVPGFWGLAGRPWRSLAGGSTTQSLLSSPCGSPWVHLSSWYKDTSILD